MYLRGEDGRCTQRRASDLTFEFRDANAGQLVDWKSIRIGDPNDSRLWLVRPDEICFVKALVAGSKPDSVIYVKPGLEKLLVNPKWSTITLQGKAPQLVDRVWCALNTDVVRAHQGSTRPTYNFAR